jgi:hypothetical protein
MPETLFPVEEERHLEVEVDPAPGGEVTPGIEVIAEPEPATDIRRTLAAGIVLAVILVALMAIVELIADSAGDSGPEPAGDSVTAPGTTPLGLDGCVPFGSPNLVKMC